MILDKKIESRERYMKLLPRLCKQVEKASASIKQQYCADPCTAPAGAIRAKSKTFQKSVAATTEALSEILFQTEGDRGIR